MTFLSSYISLVNKIVCIIKTIDIVSMYHYRPTQAACNSTAVSCIAFCLFRDMRMQAQSPLTLPWNFPTSMAGSHERSSPFRQEESQASCCKQTANNGCPEGDTINSGVAKKAAPIGSFLSDAIALAFSFVSRSAIRWLRGHQRGLSGLCR